jgi:tetratricopeptide (TPR) repeat protein
MKRILFPTLLITTLLAGGIVAFAIWKATPASAEDLLKAARQSYDEKDYATATIHLLNAVKENSPDPKVRRDTLFLLAQSYLQLGDYRAAAAQLRTLLGSYPDDREAKLVLGNLLLIGGPEGMKEASKLATEILDKNGDDVEALVLSGKASAGLRNVETSVAQYEKAANLDPQNSSIFVGLGQVQAVQGDTVAAEKTLLKAVELDPKSKGALLALASYYRLVNQPANAETRLKELLALDPTDPTGYDQLTIVYIQQGRDDEAIKLLQDTQARMPADPPNPHPSFLLSDLYAFRNRPAEARKVLTDLKAKPEFAKDKNLAAKLAINFMNDDPARSRAEIQQILNEEPGNPRALLMRGQLEAQAGQYDQARATLSDLKVVNSPYAAVNAAAQYLLGSIAVRTNQADAAIDHYQRALTINQNDLLSRTALAGVLLTKGRIADARLEADKATAINKTFPPTRLVKAAVDRAEKRYAESEKELNALVKEQPANPEIHASLAQTYLAMGRTADAERSLLRVLELQPNSFERLQQITMFYLATNQPDKAIQRINAVPESEKKASHYELLGGVYATSKRITDAEAAYKAAREKDPKNNNADAALATLYIGNGRLTEGLERLNAVIEKNPGTAGPYATRGMIYEGQGKHEEAKKDYQRALEIDPNSDVAANNLAYMLAEEGKDLSTALKWAQAVKKRHPENVAFADTLGWVYYKFGNLGLAREQLQFAVSKVPDNPTFQYHLGMINKDMATANKDAKLANEARDALRKAVNSPKDFKEKSLAEAALKEVTP